MTLTDRISLLELCNRDFPNGTAVEIGMASGCFTKQILATWPNLDHLYCIDAWKHFDEGYEDGCNLPQQVQDERYERVLLDFKDEQKVTIIRNESLLVAESFAMFQDFVRPNRPDFIYLDANHSYTSVKRDLEAWWNVLKPDGILAGHDYRDGVKRAVTEFAEKEGISVLTTTAEYCRPSGVYGAGWEGQSFVLRKQ